MPYFFCNRTDPFPVRFDTYSSPFSERGLMGSWTFPAETMAAFYRDPAAILKAMQHQSTLFKLTLVPHTSEGEYCAAMTVLWDAAVPERAQL